MASVPVVVVDALAVPVEDVHVVDHPVVVDDDEGCVIAVVFERVCWYCSCPEVCLLLVSALLELSNGLRCLAVLPWLSEKVR